MSEAPSSEPGPRRKLPPLHEIVAAYMAVLNSIDEADGEVSDADARMLDELGLSLAMKAEVMKAAHGEAMALSIANVAMAAPYMERADKLRKRATRIKERLREALELAGVTRAVGVTGGAALQPTTSVEMVEGAPVPDEYTRVVPESREPDKKTIAAALKRGEELPFAKLVQGSALHWK